jgi:hypothetical protein
MHGMEAKAASQQFLLHAGKARQAIAMVMTIPKKARSAVGLLFRTGTVTRISTVLAGRHILVLWFTSGIKLVLNELSHSEQAEFNKLVRE